MSYMSSRGANLLFSIPFGSGSSCLPTIAQSLLRVNKQLHVEAAILIFGKNTWHLAHNRRTTVFPINDRFWGFYAAYFTRVVVEFTASDFMFFRLHDKVFNCTAAYLDRVIASE